MDGQNTLKWALFKVSFKQMFYNNKTSFLHITYMHSLSYSQTQLVH